MYYYIYKITNKLDGNFYIGRRQSIVLPEDDPYFGSGKLLDLAIKKYGKENFIKEILQCYESETDLIEAEKHIVNESLVKQENCYNLSLGGHGGYTFYVNRKFNHTEESKAKISKANKGRKRPDLIERNKESDSFKNYWTGKTRSDEDKKLKSKASSQAYIEGRHPAKMLLTCPHCNITTGIGNAKRWHFENCKKI